MRKFMVFIAFVLAVQLQAQDKLLTIQDAITGYHLYPRGLSQLQWLPGGDYFSHVITDGDKQVLSIFEIEETHNGRSFEVSLDDLNMALPEADLKRLPYANWISKSEFSFHHGGKTHAYNIETKKVRLVLDDTQPSSQMSPTHDGFVDNSDNGISGKIKGNEFSITSEEDGIVIGQAVHRFEFGILNGLFWAPSGKSLAYYYMDESMVTEYPLYVLADTPSRAKMIRYPTAGAKSHHVTVRIQHQGGSEVVLKTGEPKEQFLTNISWTPDSEHVLVAVVNRAQNHMKLNMYNATTGLFEKTLFEERNERYVEPEHPAQFLKSDPTKFVWWSERDGYNHLYLYNIDGTLERQLTKGNWIVTDFHGFSTDGNKLYITSTEKSPLERHLYCVNAKSGKTKQLTKEAGYHTITANEDCTHFIDQFSSTEVPTHVQILSEDGVVFENLHTAPNPLEAYKLGEMSIGSLKSNNGDDLYYRVFKPIDFDPSKKYPVVVYLYNGPHLQLVTNRWLGGANLWYQYMAQNGYVVFSIDGRGSADRGFDFESTVHRRMAELEMEDQLTGVDWLKKQAWVDGDRIGIHGWSYGGFMTTSLMTRKPGVYKVGVAGGPVIDWSLYEVMYTERYMDTPQENPEGYAKSNLKNYVGDLEGKLLMIHGGQDDVVLWQHSLQYLEEAIKQGVQLDYFVYPHHAHNVRGQDRIHLYEKVSNYFFDHL